VGADGKGPLEGRCHGDMGTVGLVVVRRYKTCIEKYPPGSAVPPIRGICTRRVEALGVLSRCPGEDGVAAYGPLVPRDVSPDDS